MTDVDTGIDEHPAASAKDLYNAAQKHRRAQREARGLGFSNPVKECPVCGYARCRCEYRRTSGECNA